MSHGKPLPIRYRDFYDIPRAVVLEYEGDVYFLDCPFDCAIDDYGEGFSVYRLSSSVLPNLENIDWSSLSKEGEYLGTVPINRVEFDNTKRRHIDSGVIEELLRGE